MEAGQRTALHTQAVLACQRTGAPPFVLNSAAVAATVAVFVVAAVSLQMSAVYLEQCDLSMAVHSLVMSHP